MCVSLILSLVLATAGCGKSPEKDGSGNGKAAEETAAGKEQAAEETAAGDGRAGGEADYDLTSMTSEMVYATVYQMVNAPDDYVGKTVKMKGTYSASYYDPTGQHYHYCVIQDATACCAQGLEFVWGGMEAMSIRKNFRRKKQKLSWRACLRLIRRMGTAMFIQD